MKTALRRAGGGDEGLGRSATVTPTFANATRSASASLLPHALVACWLAYLGAMIWMHAAASVQPPLYDPIGYMQKAMNFWAAFDEGQFAAALRVAPTVRPHGTILLSYPFGFTPDYRGFHFRSAFLPIVCVVAAVYIAMGALRPKPAGGWWVASIALLFSSLSLFYQFDWRAETGGPVRWGLVDNFQAGVAAIAAAALLRSLYAKSLPWLMLAAIAASFTLLVKPSGAMVMLLVALLWALAVLLEWFRAHSGRETHRSRLRPYALKGAVAFAAIYLAVVTFCVYAKYLSPDNFLYAKQALAVMQDILQFRWDNAVNLFNRSAGAGLIAGCAIVAVLFLFLPALRGKRDDESRFASVSAFGCLVVWIAGTWYWFVVQAGGNQIRYFYPFMLMGAILLLPAARLTWAHAPVAARAALTACCLLPAVNIGALLASGDTPSDAWQRLSGVSVSVGENREEVAQAYGLLTDLRRAQKSVALYSFANGIPAAVFENVGMYEGMIHRGLPTFSVTTPHDWVRGWVMRTSELLDSDYILVTKYRERDAKLLRSPRRSSPSYIEALAFETWLSTLGEESGVTTVSDGSNLRLLRRIDRGRFERAIDRFVAARSWRPEFVAANQPVWWSADSLPDATRDAVARSVDFGGIYKLHALVLTRTDKELVVDVWWEELRHEAANEQRYLFFHLIDASGEGLQNLQIPLFPYDPPDPLRPVRHGRVTFNIERIAGKLASFGFGIYRPGGDLLIAKGMVSDYGGGRILIPLAPQVDRAKPSPKTTQR